jgi:pimeloyl-ACP methyl ester carboxylesterase
VTISGTCTDVAGNSSSAAVDVRYDATAPTITEVRTSRPPDVGEWFNKPVDIAFVGHDAGSGIAACTALTYAGPDDRRVAIEGACSDAAGHASAKKSFTMRYDATPPTLTDVVAQVGNRFALLKWKLSADVAAVRVTRAPGRRGEQQTVVYTGKADFYKDVGIDNRTTYEYRVSAVDEAANTTPEALARATPLPALYSPAAGARVRSPVRLEWLPVQRATYYNLQVWCRGRKILTAWPKRPQLVVPRRGKFGGRAYVLPLGACTWYVWPAFGRLIDRNYGRLVGRSTFRVLR